MSSRLLVTGAGGFVGGHVLDLIDPSRVDLVTIDHRWRDAAELEAILGDDEIAKCIHLGWYAAPADYLDAKEPNLRSLGDSIALVNGLAARGCRHLVVAGTSAEYAPQTRPLTEDDPVRPRSVYGASKAALAMLLDSSWRPSGMRVAWARLFNMTGPGEHRDRLIPFATRSIQRRDAVDLSPGEQVRDYLDVRDVAAALVALSVSEADGSYNVSSGRGLTVRELLTRLATMLDGVDLLRFGARSYSAGDAPYVVGDNTRLRGATGWEARIGVEEMLASVAEHWPAGVSCDR